MKKLFTLLFVGMAALNLNSANYSVADFEDGQIGTTKVIWGAGSCSIVDNPYKEGINASNKALAVVNNAWVPVTMSCTLPEGKTWDDYQSVKAKFCLTAGTDLSLPHLQIGLCVADWGMDNVGELDNAWGDGAIGIWYSVEIPINKTKLDAYLASNNPSYLIVKYDKSAGNNFMIDDVELIPSITSAVEAAKSEALSMSQVGENIYRLKVNEGDTNLTYSLFGVNGQVVLQGKPVAGNDIIDLNTLSEGVYLLKVQSSENTQTFKLIKR